MAFCKEFNAATQKQAGDILPVVITVYKDKTFTFITKHPPAAILLKKAANIASGSKEPNKVKVATLSKKQVMDIVKIKIKDLNARSDEAALRSSRHRPPDGHRDFRLSRFSPSVFPQNPNGRRVAHGSLELQNDMAQKRSKRYRAAAALLDGPRNIPSARPSAS